jgi:hypothetical protein
MFMMCAIYFRIYWVTLIYFFAVPCWFLFFWDVIPSPISLSQMILCHSGIGGGGSAAAAGGWFSNQKFVSLC